MVGKVSVLKTKKVFVLWDYICWATMDKFQAYSLFLRCNNFHYCRALDLACS